MIHGYFLPAEIDDMPLCPVRADLGICVLTTSKLPDPIRQTQVGLLRLLGDPSDELALAVAHARATGASLGPEYDAALAWVDALDRWHRSFEARLGHHGHRQRQVQADYQRQQMQHALAVWELAQRAIVALPASSRPHALDMLERANGSLLHLGLRAMLIRCLRELTDPVPADRALAALLDRELVLVLEGDELGAYLWFVSLGREASRLPTEWRMSPDAVADAWDDVLQELDNDDT